VVVHHFLGVPNPSLVALHHSQAIRTPPYWPHRILSDHIALSGVPTLSPCDLKALYGGPLPFTVGTADHPGGTKPLPGGPLSLTGGSEALPGGSKALNGGHTPPLWPEPPLWGSHTPLL
jgi:hypothetical protein